MASFSINEVRSTSPGFVSNLPENMACSIEPAIRSINIFRHEIKYILVY